MNHIFEESKPQLTISTGMKDIMPGIIWAYRSIEPIRSRLHSGTLDLISLVFKAITSGMGTLVPKLSLLYAFAIIHILTGNP
jgi:hypothetical protein